MNSIIELYKNGNSLRRIGEILNCSQTKVRNFLIKNGIKRRSYSESISKFLENNIPLNNYIKQVINGELLGDGCLVKRTCQSKFSFCNKNYEYAKFIYNTLKENNIPLCKNGIKYCKYYHKNWKKEYEIYNINTLCTKQFNELEKIWYKNRIKIIPESLEISPILMLHWYMGDGTLSKNSNSIVFCTDNFKIMDIRLILNKIEREVKINGKIFCYKYPRIFFPKSSAIKLLEYMGSSPFESINYKWNISKLYDRSKIFINKNELYNKYILENKTRKELSIFFNCSEHLIGKKLRLYKIKKNKKIHQKINIDKNLLYNLYIINNLKVDELSQYFNCSIQTIRGKLFEFKIRKKGKWE